MRRILACTVALAAAISGCGGGSSHHSSTKPPPLLSKSTQLSKPSCDMAVGSGHIGACVPHQVGISQGQMKLVKLPPNNGLICDTYEGNSISSYSALARAVTGCVFKAYETNYHQDSKFAQSWNAFKALHRWHSAYIFLRAGSCLHEAQTLVNIVNSVGGFNQPDTGPPVVDSEVSSAAQDTACVAARLKQLTGRTVIIYTAPGTWPGGSHADAFGWYAGYGNYTHSPCVWDCTPLAWQYTDGVFGPFPHTLAGYGSNGDVSVDYGMTRLINPLPVDPFAVLDHTVRHFGKIAAREYNTAKTWHDHACLNPARRTVCRTSYANLSLLTGRLWFVAHNHQGSKGQWHANQHADWSNHRGARFQIMWAEMHQTKR